MHTAATQWSARLGLLLCLGALAVLVTQLPGPVQVFDAVTAAAPSGAADPLAAVQSMLLATAGAIAWLLAAWAALVLVTGLAGRLPGRGGRRARRLLPRIAPAAIGRLVAAAVGVSVIAGTAACAAPGTAGSVAAASTVSVGSATGTPAPGPATQPTAGAGSEPAGSITIDWPDTASPSPTTTGPQPGTPVSTTVESRSGTTDPIASPSTVEQTPTTASVPTPATTRSTTTAPATPPPTTAGPAPTAPGPSAAPAPAPEPRTAPSAPSVTVQPGDSLWRIAAHALGSGASDADVDNAWRAWYFTNRAVIGDDPDQIVPGQSLVAPLAGGQVQS